MLNIPYFKIGDTFQVQIQWVDKNTGLGIPITQNIQVACRLLTSYNVEFLPDVIIAPDQDTQAGFFTLFLGPDITSTFKPCTITTDIKITIDGQVKHSEDFSFIVKRSITP